ncbi:MAG: vWA domain-containing protein [Patescibacteria group bacterium]
MSTASKASITGLFQCDDAKVLGITSDASDVIIANLNANNLPMCVGAPIDQLASDDVIVIEFILDASPSMEEVADLLIETFNEVMIEGLRGSSKKTANAIVIGGIAFSRDIRSLFGGGFVRLEELPKLTKREYNPSNGSSTNLYQALLDGITAASAYGLQVLQENSTPPKIIVICLTDGGDNCHQADPADVKTLTETMSRELCKFPLAVFETYERVDCQQIAGATGFEAHNFKKQPGETKEDLQRRFRHMMGTMSSSIISASQAKIGTDSKSAFWTPGQ